MNKSEIFKKSHAIARATADAVGDYLIAFSLALKDVYKSLTKNIENKLTEMGLRIWEKHGHKRIYLNSDLYDEIFSLKLTYYKTGNISSAMLNGEEISNCKAKAICMEMFMKKPFFDCIKNEFFNIPASLTVKI